MRRLGAVVASMLVGGAVMAPAAHAEPVPIIEPTIVGVIPHDPGAYSEGLEFDGPALYEATGEVGKSELRQVDPVTGAVIRAVRLPNNYWAEGITVVGDRIWQLTYKDGVVIEWDKASLTPIRELPLPGEAWGLCYDGGRFVVSDGTDRLRFYDTNFTQIGSVNVTRDGQPARGLNELECVDGQVWAAAWPNDSFVRIDPGTGAVNLVADVSSLWNSPDRNTSRQVVSGIAHIGGSEYLLSGKDWPQSYRVTLG